MRITPSAKAVCFNSQPPEGGWVAAAANHLNTIGFNSQPPEGGWGFKFNWEQEPAVSTHSRPKAAGSPAAAVQTV